MTKTYVYRMLAVLTAALFVALLAVVMKSAEAAFPGKNGKIAFMSDRDGNEEVYVMNPDGSGPANLTKNPAIDLQPAFSPAGKKIVFQTDRDDNPEIYTMNANGSNPTRLTNNPANDAQPTYAPDGNKIAFASNRDGGDFNSFEIYVIDLNGGVQRLTNNSAGDFNPSFSPN